MGGYAPGWQARCTKCGHTRDASEVGVTRIGAWSWKKYTLGWCSDCHRLRFIAVERRPAHADSASTQVVET